MRSASRLSTSTFQGRRAAFIENDHLRITVLEEGGHIAEILDKRTGINPLWVPPWPSVEPSQFEGSGADGKLLAGIMGHNLCLDLFGVPSPEEEAAGIGVHGDGPVVRYEISHRDGGLDMRAHLPLAQIDFERTIELNGTVVKIAEAVTNLCAFDRPIGWTQHVTLGPPFLKKGLTRFQVSAARSKVFESAFGKDDYLVAGAEFDWPIAPRIGGGISDLRIMNDAPASSAFTTHLMNPALRDAYFTAYNPALDLVFGYLWKAADFPWLGIWEENYSRTHEPWSGKTLARGMEFGVSPMPETRRQMVDRGSLFGTPAYRWLPAKGRLEAVYGARLTSPDLAPEMIA
jgi:hypothetical protein